MGKENRMVPATHTSHSRSYQFQNWENHQQHQSYAQELQLMMKC